LLIQLKRFKKGIKVPTISKTPGPYDGAQFDFMEILKLHAADEVSLVIQYQQHFVISIIRHYI